MWNFCSARCLYNSGQYCSEKCTTMIKIYDHKASFITQWQVWTWTPIVDFYTSWFCRHLKWEVNQAYIYLNIEAVNYHYNLELAMMFQGLKTNKDSHNITSSKNKIIIKITKFPYLMYIFHIKISDEVKHTPVWSTQHYSHWNFFNWYNKAWTDGLSFYEF